MSTCPLLSDVWVWLDDVGLKARLMQLQLADAYLDVSRRVESLEEADCSGASYVLHLHDGRLQLQPLKEGVGGAVVVDFSMGQVGYRGQQNVRQELLVKAVLGRNKQKLPNVIDVTGGLGRDSFILACVGCSVTTFERNTLVHLLLLDGLYRGRLIVTLAPILSRIDLHLADGTQCLPSVTQAQVIYMDPMFPERTKSALVKKEMRVFKDVVGADQDVESLFLAALNSAMQKIVVKRPRKSPFVAGKPPSYSVEGRSSRFDVYLC